MKSAAAIRALVKGAGEGMRETTTAPLIGWSRAFPATPAQVREARQFLAGILDGHPATDDAVLCLSELVTNATSTADPVNQAAISASVPKCTAAASGWKSPTKAAPGNGPQKEDEQNGRGLLVVAQLARNFGRTGDDQAGWTVWFECG